MPELSELFEQAKGQINFSDEAATAAAVEALKKHLGPLYQSITNLGFGAAQAKLQQQVTAAEQAKTAAETALAEEKTRHATQLRELQDKAPDVKTVNEQWEAKLETTKAEHRKAMDKLKSQVRNGFIERDQAQLADLLVELGVPKATSKILAKDPELLPARADYDESGTLTVRVAGQQISLGAGSGREHLILVAQEVVGRPEVKEILVSDVDQGSGVSGGSQPGRGDKSFYDNLRKNTPQAANDGTPKKPLKERVQGR
jgi:hypothetical protein